MPVPLLSVIIVAWRSHDEIGACVRSIPLRLAQGPERTSDEEVTRAVEVIVVDNSLNADGTADLLVREAPHVRCVVPSENLGFGRANNFGFRESSGECVLFLNPDTVCNEAALAHCVARVRAERDLGLISPKLVLADGSMDLACRRSIPTAWDGFCRASGLAAAFPRTALFAGYNLTHLTDAGTYAVGAINGAFMLGRRDVLEQVAEPTGDPSSNTTGESWTHLPQSSGNEGPTLQENAGKLPSAKPTLHLPTFPPPLAIFDERFFMYGDDLDLCIRVLSSGYRVVYDGSQQITHLKGVSVGKDHARMARAIFDANRDVYLKHFNPRHSRLVAAKYRLMFGLWKGVALWRARWHGSRQVRPA